jgi:hypothetical protein
MPRLSFRIPNPLLYCPHLILHLVYLFMHTGMLILSLSIFRCSTRSRLGPKYKLRLCVLMRSLTHPPFIDKLRPPNRLLHYQRHVLPQ